MSMPGIQPDSCISPVVLLLPILTPKTSGSQR